MGSLVQAHPGAHTPNGVLLENNSFYNKLRHFFAIMVGYTNARFKVSHYFFTTISPIKSGQSVKFTDCPLYFHRLSVS